MLFIFSIPGLIRHLWQLKTVVFLHWCLICAILLVYKPNKRSSEKNILTYFSHHFIYLPWGIYLNILTTIPGLRVGSWPTLGPNCQTSIKKLFLEKHSSLFLCTIIYKEKAHIEIQNYFIIITMGHFDTVLPTHPPPPPYCQRTIRLARKNRKRQTLQLIFMHYH